MSKMNLKRLKSLNGDSDSKKEWKKDQSGYVSPLTKELIKISKAAAKAARTHKSLGRKFRKKK